MEFEYWRSIEVGLSAPLRPLLARVPVIEVFCGIDEKSERHQGDQLCGLAHDA